jgi:lipopolysaccharide/colanic/teichoic acid biosynthesis glycosyltransferase
MTGVKRRRFGSGRIAIAVKRGTDVVIACAVLVLCAPIIAVTALLVWTYLGRPVFFVQERPGHRGRLFRMYKFRTMRDLRDRSGKLRPDSERLTTLGRLLRKVSIDELPELVNVVRGDMSLVGPRPLLVEYLLLYSPTQGRRHDVKPGLTGWAQVQGRNSPPWEERLRLDIHYVDNWSLWFDVAILLRTLPVVVRGSGVTQPGRATVDAFTGTESETTFSVADA